MTLTPEQYIMLIQAALVVLTSIAAITPTEKDDKIVGRIKNIFNKITGKK